MTSSKHRMKRPQPLNVSPKRQEPDIRKAYTTEQLAEIGAVALIWNQIETMVDFLLLIVLHIPVGSWLDVTKRINGMDGKVEILRRYSDRNRIFTEEAKQCIKISLDAIGEYKGYRDAIVHSVPFDVDRGIAQTIGSRAKITQVLVRIDALTSLFERMKMLLRELQEIDLLIRCGDPEGAQAIYGGKVPDPELQRRTKDVPLVTHSVKVFQQSRLSLPPLPEFPDENAMLSMEEK
jgi:hypothetical protein